MVENLQARRAAWPGPVKVAFIGFVLIAAFALIVEHRAHLVYAVPYLPYAIILACPLMHVFMHHGGSGPHGSPGGAPGATR
jgi:Protein of unknown function (DUF2933)